MPHANPCHNCPDRRAGSRDRPPCHTDCERRAAYVAQLEREKAARAAQHPADAYVNDRCQKAWKLHRLHKIDRRR